MKLNHRCVVMIMYKTQFLVYFTLLLNEGLQIEWSYIICIHHCDTHYYLSVFVKCVFTVFIMRMTQNFNLKLRDNSYYK